MLRRDPEIFRKTAVMWTKVFARGIHVNDYEEALKIVSALAPSESRALMELTDKHWDVQAACDYFS